MNHRYHPTSHPPDGGLSAHMRALGIRFPCSRTELKTAYRRQMLHWHPDRHNHSPASLEAANRRAQAINAAYEEFSRLLDIMEQTPVQEHPPRRPSGSPQRGFPGYGEEGLEEVMLTSSNLFSTGYDPPQPQAFCEIQGRLRLFLRGCAMGVFRDLTIAESPGKYFQKNIRKEYFGQRHDPVTR